MDTYNTPVSTFGEALEVARDLSARKSDLRLTPDGFCFDGDGVHLAGDLFDPSGRRALVERPAYSHVVGIFDIPGLNTKYIADSCPAHLRATNLNHWLEQRRDHRDPRLFIRLWDDPEEGLKVRAIGGSKFSAEIDNYPILSTLAQLTNKSGGPVFPASTPLVGGSSVGRDGMTIRMPFTEPYPIRDGRDGGTGFYQAGISLTSSENKRRSFACAPLLWRTACNNSIVPMEWGSVVIRRGGLVVTAEAVRQILEMVSSVFATGDDLSIHCLMEKMAEAALDEMTSDGLMDAIGAIVGQFSLGEDLAQQFLFTAGTYSPTRLGLINAATEVAQSADEDTRYGLEVLAGQLLTSPDMTKALAAAAKIAATEED